MIGKLLDRIDLVIALYCVWGARDMIRAWQTSPFDRLGWLVLILWSLPLALLWLDRKAETKGANPILLGTGLCLSTLGYLGSLNVLQHCGLACAVVALRPWSWGSAIWLATAVAWMPALGWVGSRLFPGGVTFVRFLIAAFPLVWVAYRLWVTKRSTS